MKKILIALLVIVLGFIDMSAKEKLSPNARMVIKHLKESKKDKNQSKINSVDKIYGCLIHVKQNTDEAIIKNAGGIIGTKAGDIWTVRAKAESIEKIAALDDVIYLQLDEPIGRKLDAARKYSYIDSVQKGINLNHGPYSGLGVVTGIIDCGFDYTHPCFYDSAGNATRIRAVWEQKRNGVPPSGYSYGRELRDSNVLFKGQTDTSKQSHGTHVAGIVTGNGIGANGLYKGVATNSDIVFVAIHPGLDEWTSTSVSSVVDGMAYILRYADSVKKPAVCNLSWGLTLGPHDGQSLFCRAINNLSGKGKILVVAAGNEGDEQIHFNHTFDDKDTMFNTFFNFSKYYEYKKSCIDFWGETNCDFEISLTMFDTTKKAKGQSAAFSVKNSHIIDTFLIGADNDTCFISIVATPSEFNGKPRMMAFLENKSLDKILITGKGKKGTLHFWNSYIDDFKGIYGTFVDDSISWAKSGNTDYTIGDFPCGDSIISVGAYTTKNKWTSSNLSTYSFKSTLGDIAFFSSHGPRLDGQFKPDIAAPGYGVVACVNSFDSSFLSGHSLSAYSIKNFQFNGFNYKYAILSGTSMAAPMVSGVVALLLEKNPELTPSEVRRLLQNTANVDSFVKNPNLWGAGKLNAWAALRALDGKNDVDENVLQPYSDILISPNPTNGLFNIKVDDGEQIEEVLLYDLFGNCVYSQKNIHPNMSDISVDGTFLSEGYYCGRLKFSSGYKSFNLVVIK